MRSTIRLLIGLAVVGIVLFLAATTPQYTAADAERYATAHPIGGKIQPRGTASVQSIHRLTRDDVSAQLGFNTEAAVAAVYVVEWRGAFAVSAPGGSVIVYPKAYQILDAQSGQLLAEMARA